MFLDKTSKSLSFENIKNEAKINDDDKDSIETLDANLSALKELENNENPAIDEVDKPKDEIELDNKDNKSCNDLNQIEDSYENICAQSFKLPKGEEHQEIRNQSKKLRDMMLEPPAIRPVLMKMSSIDLQKTKTVLLQNKDDVNGIENNPTSLNVEPFETVEFKIQVSPSPSPKFQ